MIEAYTINPVPKPRMTQSDKWKRRPCTERYWRYKDEIKRQNVRPPSRDGHIIFVLPVSKSWSLKKKKAMIGQPHLQKPDKDNLEKGLLDACYDEDCCVWDGRCTKLWGWQGMIIIVPAQPIREIIDTYLINWKGELLDTVKS